MPLTEDETILLRHIFTFGVSTLGEHGYTPEQASQFMQRSDVQAGLTQLAADFGDEDSMMSRTRFTARRNLARLAGSAVAVLGECLRGEVHATGPDGNVLIDKATGRPVVIAAAPSKIQFNAAKEVLRGIGVVADTDESKPKIDLNVLLARPAGDGLMIEMDKDRDSYIKKAVSRERMRIVVEQLSRELPAAREDLNQRLLPIFVDRSNENPRKEVVSRELKGANKKKSPSGTVGRKRAR